MEDYNVEGEGEYEEGGSESSRVLPKRMAQLRACMICSLVKSQSQFVNDGCDNCTFLSFREGKVKDYTSSSFEGLIALINPQQSWVAKWQKLDPRSLLPFLFFPSPSSSFYTNFNVYFF